MPLHNVTTRGAQPPACGFLSKRGSTMGRILGGGVRVFDDVDDAINAVAGLFLTGGGSGDDAAGLFLTSGISKSMATTRAQS